MATETILVTCPSGEYTLVGQSITNISLQIRGQSARQTPDGALYNSTGKIKLRVVVAASLPEPHEEGYWLYSGDEPMSFSVDTASVYVMPDTANMEVKVAVLRG